MFSLVALKVNYNRRLHMCTAGGVEMLGLHTTIAPKRSKQQPNTFVKAYKFVPHFESEMLRENQELVAYRYGPMLLLHNILWFMYDTSIVHTKLFSCFKK